MTKRQALLNPSLPPSLMDVFAPARRITSSELAKQRKGRFIRRRHGAPLADLNRTLEGEATRTEAFEIIRGLVEEIALAPEDGKLRVDLKGDLAAILNLAEDGKKPATARCETNAKKVAFLIWG